MLVHMTCEVRTFVSYFFTNRVEERRLTASSGSILAPLESLRIESGSNCSTNPLGIAVPVLFACLSFVKV